MLAGVTRTLEYLCQRDPKAHFLPVNYTALVWTWLDTEIFSFPPGIRFNPLRLIYHRIQGEQLPLHRNPVVVGLANRVVQEVTTNDLVHKSPQRHVVQTSWPANLFMTSFYLLQLLLDTQLVVAAACFVAAVVGARGQPVVAPDKTQDKTKYSRVVEWRGKTVVAGRLHTCGKPSYRSCTCAPAPEELAPSSHRHVLAARETRWNPQRRKNPSRWRHRKAPCLFKNAMWHFTIKYSPYYLNTARKCGTPSKNKLTLPSGSWCS